MSLLLAKGATIEIVSKTKDGQLHLHTAAAGRHFEAIEPLLDRGAIVHAWARSENGQLALHGAAAGGYLEAIRLLFDREADVNGWAGTKNGQTALHPAAAGGHLEAIGFLVDRLMSRDGQATRTAIPPYTQRQQADISELYDVFWKREPMSMDGRAPKWPDSVARGDSARTPRGSEASPGPGSHSLCSKHITPISIPCSRAVSSEVSVQCVKYRRPRQHRDSVSRNLPSPRFESVGTGN